MILYLVSAIALVLALFPFCIYPLSLKMIRIVANRAIHPKEDARHRSMSILFCAFNEERVIEQKVLNLIAVTANYPGETEILAYLDGCTDATEAIVRRFDQVRIFSDQARHGKSHGMNTLVDASRGELLIFTDANVMLANDALVVSNSYFANEEVGCLCGNLHLTNPDVSATAAVGATYWKLEERVKQLESETGSTMGADGSLFAIRRALSRRIPLDIIDDMYTSLSVLIMGKRVIRADAFKAYETATVKSRDEFRRKVRIACRAFNCYRLLSSELHRTGLLNVYKFYGHKVLRWFGALSLALSACTFLAALALDGAWLWFYGFFAWLGFVVVGWRLGIPPLTSVGEILLAMLGTGYGVLQSLRGERYQTWGIASSSRPSAEN